MAEPFEGTPLPMAQLRWAGVEKLIGAADVIGHYLGRGQGDRLIVGRLLGNLQSELLVA